MSRSKAVHHVLQLIALLARHGVEQRLHLRHLLFHVLSELIERLDARREELAPLPHEVRDVGVLAVERPLGQLVEVPDHLLDPPEVLLGHVLDALLDPLEVVLQHLLLQLVEQLVELAPRLRVHEVVVAELLHAPARIRRERVELTEAAVGHPAEQFPHLRGHFALAALWRALHRRLCAGLPCLVAIRGQLVEPALDAGALGVDDIVEPLLDIVHHRERL